MLILDDYGRGPALGSFDRNWGGRASRPVRRQQFWLLIISASWGAEIEALGLLGFVATPETLPTTAWTWYPRLKI